MRATMEKKDGYLFVEKSNEEDPYSFLEEVESEESLAFANEANDYTLKALGDPKSRASYERILSVLECNDRIPYVSKYGTDKDGDSILFNLWKDSTNTKGLWRKTTLSSYKTDNPTWKTVLDIDELGRKNKTSWVWKGSRSLPKGRDPKYDGQTTRALLNLSRGGADAVVVREFDLLKEEFVPEGEAFVIPEAKTRASYKSRDVLLVGTDFEGEEQSMTDSGYPRIVKEWIRGTDLKDAKTIFEGEKTDVSVSCYIDDQRVRNGPIYEVHYRSITFYTSKYWVRTTPYEFLLTPDDPERVAFETNTGTIPEEFVEVDIPLDASIDFVAKWMIISLRSDWSPDETKSYKAGSVIYVDANTFLKEGKEKCQYNILFEPTEKTAFETYSVTKNYIIVNIMDNVKSKLLFFKIKDDSFELVGGDNEAKAIACSASAIDPSESDLFWYTTSGYTQPSALHLADAVKVEEDVDEGTEEHYIVEKLKSLPHMYESEGLVVTQKVATSKDGTEVPYFLVSKKDTVLDGNTPTLLYGYGGFEISLGPKYIASSGAAWLEKGGAYVEACIRGGGEFGPSWHQAALKANRNKSYEDFIAVAEDLISTNLCRPETLAIRGGSNGGLLMGNMYTMRPDLFGAIHCAVPLLDMKRYHVLLAGASWMAEYGDPDTDDWEDFLYKYSSYHQIDSDVQKYPPILFTTSTRDDRVHPAHARKMVKKLWDLGKGKDWPTYYYENIEGGHGGAADSKQSAFMTALAYDFMWETLCKGINSTQLF